MRSLLAALVLALVVAPFAGGTVLATDQVPNDMLAQMGLANMEKLSDAQGEQIRGKAFMLNFVLVNNSAYVYVNAKQRISRSRRCCNGIAINGVVVNNSYGVVVNARQSINF